MLTLREGGENLIDRVIETSVIAFAHVIQIGAAFNNDYSMPWLRERGENHPAYS